MIFQEAYDPVRSLGSAWNQIGRARLTLLLGGFLSFVTDGGNGAGILRIGEHRDELPSWTIALLIVAAVGACVFGVLVLLFNSLIQIGLARALERVMSTGKQETTDLFEPRGLFGSMLLTQLLKMGVSIAASLPLVVIFGVLALLSERAGLPEGAAVAIGFAVFLIYLPVLIYVGVGVSLATQAVAIEGMRPMEAMSRSWSLAKGHRIRLCIYYFVMGIISVSGLLLCCVGVFATGAWTEVARFESYLRLVREGDPATWMRPAPGIVAASM
jgi:hypothetical protein